MRGQGSWYPLHIAGMVLVKQLVHPVKDDYTSLAACAALADKAEHARKLCEQPGRRVGRLVGSQATNHVPR